VGWTDPATLHRSDDGGGVFNSFKSVRHGTLAELVHFVESLPESERPKYCIEKEGDHRLQPGEIAALARRPDYPASV
jgi:hypothetical protein